MNQWVQIGSNCCSLYVITARLSALYLHMYNLAPKKTNNHHWTIVSEHLANLTKNGKKKNSNSFQFTFRLSPLGLALLSEICHDLCGGPLWVPAGGRRQVIVRLWKQDLAVGLVSVSVSVVVVVGVVVVVVVVVVGLFLLLCFSFFFFVGCWLLLLIVVCFVLLLFSVAACCSLLLPLVFF